jgi:DNA-binding NarL/FixJ family response regulator
VLKRSRNLAAGTGSSAELLFEQYLVKVFSYMSFWVNNTQLAEDLTLQALKGVSFGAENCDRDSENLSISLFTAARTLIQGNLPHSAWPGFNSPHKSGNRDQFKLQAGLERLSSQEKEIVSLKLSSGLSNRSIGRILGRPEADIGLHLRQALDKLNGCF